MHFDNEYWTQYIRIKGIVHRIYMRGHWTHFPAQEYGPLFQPLCRYVDVMVSQIGPKWFTSDNNGLIGLIHDTKKSTVAATQVEK